MAIRLVGCAARGRRFVGCAAACSGAAPSAFSSVSSRGGSFGAGAPRLAGHGWARAGGRLFRGYGSCTARCAASFGHGIRAPRGSRALRARRGAALRSRGGYKFFAAPARANFGGDICGMGAVARALQHPRPYAVDTVRTRRFCAGISAPPALVVVSSHRRQARRAGGVLALFVGAVIWFVGSAPRLASRPAAAGARSAAVLSLAGGAEKKAAESAVVFLSHCRRLGGFFILFIWGAPSVASAPIVGRRPALPCRNLPHLGSTRSPAP